MFNLLRMDLRRLFKTRSFYVVLAVTAALLVMTVAMVSAVIDQAKLDALKSTGIVVTGGDSEDVMKLLRGMNRLDFLHECLGNGFLLALACTGVTLFVNGDFSSGCVKNICFARPRRWEYVLSKIFVAGFYSAIITILGVLVSLVCPVLTGLRLEPSSFAEIMQYTFWMWLPTWAFSLLGLALVLLTRSSTLGVIVAVAAGGGLTAALLQGLCQGFGWPDLAQHLLNMVVRAQCAPMPDGSRIAMILGCSLGWGALYAAGSFAAMEKRDI